MLIADMHCDLPHKIYTGGMCLHYDTEKLKKQNRYIQIFAAFVDKMQTDNPNGHVKQLISCFKSYAEKNDRLTLIEKYKHPENGKVLGVLSVEGGEALGGKLSELDALYEMGVRFMTLTWNYPNMLGEGTGVLTQNKGLTAFGREVVRKMNEINMTVDVSHLTEAGFYDVAGECTKPFCATHSNSHRLCPHPRNLSDEQFCEIKKRGGLVGINLYPPFLTGSHNATATDAVRHIEHFMSLGGENTLSLGCDLDGVDFLPNGFNGIQDIEILAEELLKINYPEKIIAKIIGENLDFYLKSVLI